jgi:hypothetical protein
MICDRARKVDVRKLGKVRGESVWVAGRLIEVTTTPCHLGGVRSWFVCPTCGRRCAILYPHDCRLCRNGHYASELQSPLDRKLNKAFKIRGRLGQRSGGTLAPFPEKPKRMRWHTYLRLRDQGMALEREIWAADARKLGCMED